MNTIRSILAVSALLVILFTFILISFNPGYGLFPFGHPEEKSWRIALYKYYIENGANLSGGANIVTDIVFDLRGYDTLGEATVLFTAIAGALALLRRGGAK